MGPVLPVKHISRLELSCPIQLLVQLELAKAMLAPGLVGFVEQRNPRYIGLVAKHIAGCPDIVEQLNAKNEHKHRQQAVAADKQRPVLIGHMRHTSQPELLVNM